MVSVSLHRCVTCVNRVMPLVRAEDLRVRRASRIIVKNGDRILLFEYFHASGALNGQGSYWTPPGGGVKSSETFLDAARRELREETGFAGEISDTVLAERYAPLILNTGEIVLAHEQYFLYETSCTQISTDQWTASEQESIKQWKWLGADEFVGLQNLWPKTLKEIAFSTSDRWPLFYRSQREQVGDLVADVQY